MTRTAKREKQSGGSIGKRTPTTGATRGGPRTNRFEGVGEVRIYNDDQTWVDSGVGIDRSRSALASQTRQGLLSPRDQLFNMTEHAIHFNQANTNLDSLLSGRDIRWYRGRQLLLTLIIVS